jgi:TRAP transporter TAXI family solute receptor
VAGRERSRRSVLAGLAGLGAASGALATGCLERDWRSFPTSGLTIATGNSGGVFARYGEALATVVQRRLSGITCDTELTDASVENLRMVDAGTCDIGFSLGDTASDALHGSEAFDRPLDVVALARIYDSFVHLVVLADSPVRTVADLRGRRVGVGSDASGTRVVAERVLRHSGLDMDDIAASSVPLEACADALLAGTLDAFFFVSGFPSQAVRALSRRRPIRLIGLRRVSDAMIETYGSVYVVGPIPASAYGLSESVETVSVRNYLVVRRDMPARLAYAVTRVMFEAQGEIGRIAPQVRQSGIGAAVFTSPLDLHQGARRYFRQRRG